MVAPSTNVVCGQTLPLPLRHETGSDVPTSCAAGGGTPKADPLPARASPPLKSEKRSRRAPMTGRRPRREMLTDVRIGGPMKAGNCGNDSGCSKGSFAALTSPLPLSHQTDIKCLSESTDDAAEAPNAEAPNAPESRNAAKSPNSPESQNAAESPNAPESRNAAEAPNAPESRNAAKSPNSPESRNAAKSPNSPESRNAAESPNSPASRSMANVCRPLCASQPDCAASARLRNVNSNSALAPETPLGATPDVNVLITDVEDFMAVNSLLVSPMQVFRLCRALLVELLVFLFGSMRYRGIQELKSATHLSAGDARELVGLGSSSPSGPVSTCPTSTPPPASIPVRWLGASKTASPSIMSPLDHDTGATDTEESESEGWTVQFFPSTDHEELWWLFHSTPSAARTSASARCVATGPPRKGASLAIIVPGNPGIVRAYGNFAKYLGQKMKCDVCVIGHRGHHGRPVGPLQNYSMHCQFGHHAARVRHLTSPDSGYERINLLGHSIGGYFVLRALDPGVIGEHLETGVVLLMPTLSRFCSISYWTLNFLTWAPVTPLVAGAVKILNYVVPRSNWDKYIREIGSGNFLHNVAGLVRRELLELPAKGPDSLVSEWCGSINRQGKRLLVLYAATDPYVSPKTQAEVRGRLASISTVNDAAVVSWSRLSHSFVLVPSEYKLASKLFMAWRSGVATEDLMAAGSAADLGESHNTRLSSLRRLGQQLWISTGGAVMCHSVVAYLEEKSFIIHIFGPVSAAIKFARAQLDHIHSLVSWIPRVGARLIGGSCAKRSSESTRLLHLAPLKKSTYSASLNRKFSQN